jgi:hypothetical protein
LEGAISDDRIAAAKAGNLIDLAKRLGVPAPAPARFNGSSGVKGFKLFASAPASTSTCRSAPVAGAPPRLNVMLLPAAISRVLKRKLPWPYADIAIMRAAAVIISFFIVV